MCKCADWTALSHIVMPQVIGTLAYLHINSLVHSKKSPIFVLKFKRDT